jgi:hypothetical protein
MGFASKFEDAEDRRGESMSKGLKVKRPELFSREFPQPETENIPPGMAVVTRWILDDAQGWHSTRELVIKCSA